MILFIKMSFFHYNGFSYTFPANAKGVYKKGGSKPPPYVI